MQRKNIRLTREEKIRKYDSLVEELWYIPPSPKSIKNMKKEIKNNINYDEGGYYATLDKDNNLVRSGITENVYQTLQKMDIWPNEEFYMVGIPYRRNNLTEIKRYKQNLKRIYNGQSPYHYHY